MCCGGTRCGRSASPSRAQWSGPPLRRTSRSAAARPWRAWRRPHPWRRSSTRSARSTLRPPSLTPASVSPGARRRRSARSKWYAWQASVSTATLSRPQTGARPTPLRSLESWRPTPTTPTGCPRTRTNSSPHWTRTRHRSLRWCAMSAAAQGTAGQTARPRSATGAFRT